MINDDYVIDEKNKIMKSFANTQFISNIDFNFNFVNVVDKFLYYNVDDCFNS